MSTASLVALRSRMREHNTDAAVISGFPNIRYLSGFSGSNAMLLVTRRDAIVFTDPRYTIQAEAETHGYGVKAVTVSGSLEVALAKRLRKFRRIGFENSRIRYSAWVYLFQNLPLGAELVPLGDPVGEIRMVKTELEQAAIRASVQLNSQAFGNALARFKAGMSERDLAAEIEYQMRLLGADKPSFETIVAFKKNSALPHAQPGPTRIEGNGLLLIDMGTMRGGYASDMTRCVHLGKPGAKTRNLYNAVLDAQLAALEAVKPGVSAGDVDKAARKVLGKHGMEKEFVHSTGHGLGLEIHEPPRLGRREPTQLSPGMAITIEPGAYFEGFGGVRIEDTVFVTPNGCEILTPTSKELTIL